MGKRYLKVALLRCRPELNVTEYVEQAFLYWSDDINSLYELLLKYFNDNLRKEDIDFPYTLEDVKDIPIIESGDNSTFDSRRYWIELPSFMDIRDYFEN